MNPITANAIATARRGAPDGATNPALLLARLSAELLASLQKIEVAVAGGLGVTAHGALTGLGNNDHPQYGMDLGTPTNPWSLDPTGVVGRRVYDSSNDLIWTLLANDSGGLIWEFSPSGISVGAGYTANEDIQVFDGGPTLVGTIPLGAPLAGYLRGLFNGCGLETHVFFRGGNLFIWQEDSAQANPVLPYPYTTLYSLYGLTSLATATVGSSTTGSLWRSQRAFNGFANPPSWACCGFFDPSLGAPLSVYTPGGSFDFNSVPDVFGALTGNDFAVPSAYTDQLIYGGMIPKTFRVGWSISAKDYMGTGYDLGGGIGVGSSFVPVPGSVSVTKPPAYSHAAMGGKCIVTLNPGDYIRLLVGSGMTSLQVYIYAASITVTEV